MPSYSVTDPGKSKDKNSYAFRPLYPPREIKRQEFLCFPATLPAPENQKTRIPMPPGHFTGPGKSKNQESLCISVSSQAPENQKTSIPMPSYDIIGPGKLKNKISYASRSHHRPREIKKQASLCPAVTSSTPRNQKYE